MTWHISESLRCLLEPGAESLVENSLAGAQSALSKSSPTAGKSSCGGKTKGTSTRSRYGTTCEHLTELSGAGGWMSSLADSPAKTSALQEKALESTASEAGSGQKWQGSLAKYDPASRSWKIAQCLFDEVLPESSETWPRWGTVVDGECFPAQTAAVFTYESGYGLSLPTTGKNEFKGSSKKRFIGSPDFRGAKMSEGLRTYSADPIYLNPSFAELVMMWPMGWTDLAPLATDKFREWQQQHGAFLEAHECPE